MRKRALITGITGQVGSYLAELLLSKGYEVLGLMRAGNTDTSRIDHLYTEPDGGDELRLEFGDLTDASSLNRVIRRFRPDEIYNLGSQSHVSVSFDSPDYTVDSIAMGTLRLLEAIRDADHECRYYQASSSEMFGRASETPLDEKALFRPQSPYGVAKCAAHWFTVNYREAYGMYACNGILFNHESPRRGPTFVTRKITRAVARIQAGLMDRLYLGNLDARRDWGYAPEYAEAIFLMMQQEAPDDYVIATGRSHSVREFCERAFARAEMDWQDHVESDDRYLRPTDVAVLVGDASRAKAELGWEARCSFNELVDIMVDADIRALESPGWRGWCLTPTPPPAGGGVRGLTPLGSPAV